VQQPVLLTVLAPLNTWDETEKQCYHCPQLLLQDSHNLTHARTVNVGTGSVKGVSITWDKVAGSCRAVPYMLLTGVAGPQGHWAPGWPGVRKASKDIQGPALALSGPWLLTWLCRITASSPEGMGLGSSFSHCAVTMG